MVEKLKSKPRVFDKVLVIRNIAELGKKGAKAGPALMGYLNGSDWELRLASARAVGFVHYTEAKGKLIQLLDNPEDWRLALSAAESLGRLQAAEAAPTLEKVAKNHWYPPVREAAARALQAIQSKRPFRASYEDDGNYPVFFGYEGIGLASESYKLMEKEDPSLIRFPIADRSKDAVEVVIKEPGADPERVIRKGIGIEIEGRKWYLVGSDNGEFGGSIDCLDSMGNLQTLVNANTEAVYKAGKQIFAVTGLAHLAMSEGMIYKITKAPDRLVEPQIWEATPWRALPGAPRFSRLLQDGTLFVRCYGGIVLVFPDGTMKSLTRAEAFKESEK